MNWKKLTKEIKFRADRSSGSGGQHVNKVATKVTLTFFPNESLALSDHEKTLLFLRLKNKLSKEGALIVSEQNYRSQFRNRKHALQKLELIIEEAIRPPRPARKKIKRKTNTAASRKKKTIHSEKKANRRKIRVHDL